MSEILKKMKSDHLQFRKDRDQSSAAFMSSLIGDVESKAVMVVDIKTVSDDVVIATLKSSLKRIDDFMAIENLPDNVVDNLKNEHSMIMKYVPSQMSEDDLRKIFSEIDHSNMGMMMKHLKENFAGLYDGKMASQIAKEFV